MVYKGVLPNGEMVAVKKLNSLLPGVYDNQYKNEAHHLMRLKHPNIVLLLGCCTKTENIYVEHEGKHICAEKSERLLCLEYMPNGNLRERLKDKSSELTWETRYKIIEGICYGLEYLHEKSKLSPILHMDLKPANILLDNNMVPKIADFGLSRLFGEDNSKTYTINQVGTLGYMAPEHINRGIISTKSDIFSLGVIIIEIVTGHRYYPEETGGTSSQEFTELVLENWKYTSLEINHQQIKRCVKTGLECVKLDWLKRPTINQVIKMLQEAESAIQSHPMLINEDDIQVGFLDGSHGSEAAPQAIPLELLKQITNNFSEKQILGSGAFGTVYKGVLNGKEVAVKLLHSVSHDYEENFMKEFNNLRRFNHPNIVKLLGYCYETKRVAVEYEGKYVLADKIYRALCFDYMHHGSLQRHLDDESRGLNWQTRYKIIKGTCEGLNYLHKGLETPMLHLDLQPQNILLDRNMVPTLADFGSSKFVIDNRIQETSSPLGTIRYCPPEYIEGNFFSDKFDIFSLGVIMIEIIAGSKGYDRTAEMPFQEFIDHVQENWRKRIHQAISGCTSPKCECRQVKRCIEIALQCVRREQKERPDIGDIISTLNETENNTEKSVTTSSSRNEA